MFMLINPPDMPGVVNCRELAAGLGYVCPQDNYYLFPSREFVYAVTFLNQANFLSGILDAQGHDWDRGMLLEKLGDFHPDAIAMTCSFASLDYDMETAREIKKRIDVPLYLFGPSVWTYKEYILKKDFIDGVIPYYAGQVLLDLAKGNELPAGFYKRVNGDIIGRELKDSIWEDLPIPSWHLFPYQNYHFGRDLEFIKPFFPVWTSIGCPFPCVYCPYPVYQGNKVRFRPITNVIKELKYLSKNFGMKSVLFRDPEFSIDKERTMNLCRQIIDSGISFKWRCETRIDFLDKDLILLMKKAGCQGIHFGVESIDSDVLNKSERASVDTDSIYRKVKFMNQLGIKVMAFFLIGLPGDNYHSFLETVKFAKSLNIDHAGFSVATPFPGTELHDWAVENKFILSTDPKDYSTLQATMRTEYLSGEDINKMMQFTSRYLQMRFKDIKYRIRIYGPLQIIKELIKLVYLPYQIIKMKIIGRL